MPVDLPPSAMVILIPGHGKTHFRDSNWYFDPLIDRLSNMGLAVFRWDRAGCGNSEGTYDHQQSVQSSALEALAAIEELQKRKISGASKIGFWGISRGGYICPLIIQAYPETAFWISVSGTDGLNSWDYMFESNLVFAGRRKRKAKLLVAEYLAGLEILESGGSYEEFMAAQSNLYRDTFCLSYLGREPATFDSLAYAEYAEVQRSVRSQINYTRDPKTGSVVVVPQFKEVLSGVSCPVLAIFGKKDFIVDWKKTRKLYQKTLGKNPDRLTIKSFPNANHSLLKCRTGASNEKLDDRQYCSGYLDTITDWLKEKGFSQ